MDAFLKSAPTVEAARERRHGAVPLGYFDRQPDAHPIRSEAEALDAAGAFAAHIAAGSARRDRERILPFDELRQLSAAGLLAVTVPQSHGGLGISTTALIEIFKTIARADAAIGQIPQNHFVFARAIEVAGSERQKEFFFDRLLKGDRFGNALSERGTRTVLDFKTRLTRDGDGRLRLNGTKFYCTGALFAHWVPVFALDDDEHLVAAYVPQGTPGLEIVDDWSGVGQRVTASGTVHLRDAEVPPEYVVPIWQAYERPSTLGAFAQILHVAIDVGIAAAALDDAAEFVRERARPWAESGVARAADEPHIVKRFGELFITLRSAEALLKEASGIFDRLGNRPVSEAGATEASIAVAAAKAVATDAAIEITNALFELGGTSSMDEKHNLDRHWRNARLHTLHDPVRWKAFHLGNWFLNKIAPPRVYS